ncbi:class I SAM-dependent DNA methyltransferase [Mobilicoccus caccae]|uniref:Methyltransferase n=1 Tax=Mobilicoccus caccae TaxID=1859295 RepID=A0ABQ6IVH2_9MICO|nr:class I SAM-dependent methyltransferase [Mobilicoccus caccae]GMA41370.1 methyltransferase [Mobilicoccus caccae]
MTTTEEFDSLYAGDPDPWQVASSWYERRKIEIVLACLRRPRHGFVWDAGCGTGELTAALAARADRVLATDPSAQAVALAGARLAGEANVHLERSTLPARPESLTDAPDLVVLSEVLYYLSAADRQATYALLDEVSHPETDLAIVHWGPRTEGATCSGLAAFNEASSELNARGWGRLVTHTDAEFLIGLFSKDIPDEVGGRDDA